MMVTVLAVFITNILYLFNVGHQHSKDVTNIHLSPISMYFYIIFVQSLFHMLHVLCNITYVRYKNGLVTSH